jgi:hypothetical protein
MSMMQSKTAVVIHCGAHSAAACTYTQQACKQGDIHTCIRPTHRSNQQPAANKHHNVCHRTYHFHTLQTYKDAQTKLSYTYSEVVQHSCLRMVMQTPERKTWTLQVPQTTALRCNSCQTDLRLDKGAQETQCVCVLTPDITGHGSKCKAK